MGSGGKAVAQACHAGKLEEIEALFDYVSKEFGRLDILINNAATNPYYGPATGLFVSEKLNCIRVPRANTSAGGRGRR